MGAPVRSGLGSPGVAQDLSTWQEIALVASPALAAIAAGASWASVLQTRRLRREDQEPGLQAQMMRFPDGTLGAAVTNAGPGVARGVQIYLVHRGLLATGPIGHGFMFPGDTRIVRTPIPEVPEADARMIVSCRDRGRMPHAWDGHEHHRVAKTWRKKPRYQALQAIFEGFYPDIPLNDLERVPIQVMVDAPEQTADPEDESVPEDRVGP